MGFSKNYSIVIQKDEESPLVKVNEQIEQPFSNSITSRELGITALLIFSFLVVVALIIPQKITTFNGVSQFISTGGSLLFLQTTQATQTTSLNKDVNEATSTACSPIPTAAIFLISVQSGRYCLKYVPLYNSFYWANCIYADHYQQFISPVQANNGKITPIISLGAPLSAAYLTASTSLKRTNIAVSWTLTDNCMLCSNENTCLSFTVNFVMTQFGIPVQMKPLAAAAAVKFPALAFATASVAMSRYATLRNPINGAAVLPTKFKIQLGGVGLTKKCGKIGLPACCITGGLANGKTAVSIAPCTTTDSTSIFKVNTAGRIATTNNKGITLVLNANNSTGKPYLQVPDDTLWYGELFTYDGAFNIFSLESTYLDTAVNQYYAPCLSLNKSKNTIIFTKPEPRSNSCIKVSFIVPTSIWT